MEHQAENISINAFTKTMYKTPKKMDTSTELNALQNAANKIGLVIQEYFFEDKRKTSKKYFARKDNTSVSPVLDYKNMNYFLLGWIRATENK
jgi:hypothetical protein